MNFFNQVIKRVVSFSVESYFENKENIADFFSENELFQLSVLIASRSLYNDVLKDKFEKTRIPLEKYFSRAHFNPIPFGTFSSVGSLEWGAVSELSKKEGLRLKVDYDNLFVSEKYDEVFDENWKDFVYYTNPSIHFLNEKKVSFYKSEKTSGSFQTKYVELDYDENIEWLTTKFKAGATIGAVSAELVDSGFEINEIETFLLEIINAGIIISNASFFPYSRPISLFDLKSELVAKNIFDLNDKNNIQRFIKAYVNEQNSHFVEDRVNKFNIHSIASFDMQSGTIEFDIQEKILRYINFTLKYNLNYTPVNKVLKEFGNKFYHSFNDGFLPLSKVFNPYSGLKYSSIKLKNESKLPDDIIFKILSGTGGELHLSDIGDDFLIQKDKMPPSFSVIFEKLKNKNTGKEYVYFKYLGGTSALNFISRFNHVSEALCQDIVAFEKEIFTDKIVAEVNMVSKPRATNIIPDHKYYDFCIPINTVYAEESASVFLSDLYLRFNGADFSLVSKKHKKAVVPRITSAVNYALSDSEIYKFLADLQFQNNEIHHINFNLNYYKNILLPFVPRIFLGDDILLYPSQLLLVNDSFCYDEFKKYLNENINKYSFSKRIVITEEKGDVVIDVENDNQLRILFQKLDKEKKIYVSECLYDSFLPLVKDGSNHFSHEFIASVKNDDFKTQPEKIRFPEEKDDLIKSCIPIVGEWLYFDLFCNSYAVNDLILDIYENIILKNEVDQFFFVRYDYPENHLRARFKTTSSQVKDYIIAELEKIKRNGIILNYKIVPYEQENYRYGGEKLMGLTEKIFFYDSLNTITDVLKNNYDVSETYICAILKIKSYLDFFEYDIDEMIGFCEYNIESFSREFTLTQFNRKNFNKAFSEIRKMLESINYSFSIENEIDFKVEVNTSLNSSELFKYNYVSDVIHMSMNRLFDHDQRFNEFKSYFLTKCYLNQIKYSRK